MNEILFSVVVSIFNIEKYVKRCIDSIVNQTYQNLEIILVDDGSTDSSGKICDSFSKIDARIKVIHKTNQGLGMARNTGLDYATGEYICFFDGDDFVDLRLFEICNNYLKEKKVDILDYDFYSYANNHFEINKFNRKEKLYLRKEIMDVLVPNTFFDSKDYRFYGSAWTKIYRLNTCKRIGFKFVSEREFISEDYFTILKFYNKIDSIMIIKEKLYFYCLNDGSLTHSYIKDRLEKNMFQYEQSIKLILDQNLDKKLISYVGMRFFINILAHIKTLNHNAQFSIDKKSKEIYLIIKNKNFVEIINSIHLHTKNYKLALILLLIKMRMYAVVFLIFKHLN